MTLIIESETISPSKISIGFLSNEEQFGFIPSSQELTINDLSDRRTIWVMYGWNGCESVFSTLNQLDKTSKLIVYENILGNIKFSSNDLEKFKKYLELNKLQLVVDSVESRAIEEIDALVDFADFDKWQALNGYAGISHGKNYKSFFSNLESKLNYKLMCFTTTIDRSKWFYQQSLINLPRSFTTIDRKDYLNNLVIDQRPFLIIGAGPSLAKQLPILKNNQSKYRIAIAAQVYDVCAKNGIKPDFIFTSDTIVNAKWSDNLDAFLISDFGVHPENVWHYKANNFFTSHNAVIEGILDFLDVEYTHVSVGGSVITTAFSFAKIINANPIVFIGIDLALTNDKSHVDGAASKSHSLESNVSYTEGYYGGLVRTNFNLQAAKHWLEEKISEDRSVLVFNCTEGGAKIKNAVQIPFDNLCDELSSFDLNQIIPKYDECSINLDKLCELKDNLNRMMLLIEESHLGLSKHLKKLLGSKSIQARAQAKIDILTRYDNLNSVIKDIVQIYGAEEILWARRDDKSDEIRVADMIKGAISALKKANKFHSRLDSYYAELIKLYKSHAMVEFKNFSEDSKAFINAFSEDNNY